MKTKNKKETKNIYDVKVGDIFVMIWGYDQTNADFFQVVELKGEQMIKIKEIKSELVRREEYMCGYVKPIKDSFCKKSIFYEGEDTYKKVFKEGDTIYLKMTSFANAYLTNENDEHFVSWWA